ncbi:T9SS type A sorting domain-containing protein [bacterium SCSIO 12741]|nr:T9SS type A sorting domain-containing protein [bacterium SCSIO 12741]
MKRLLLAMGLLICTSGYLQAQLFVDASATGNNDGSSWQNAFTNLDTALANYDVVFHNEIWIAAGTYKPGDGQNRNSSFNVNAPMYGGFAGTETNKNQRDLKANPTILSGDLSGNDNHASTHPNTQDRSDNSYTVVKLVGGGLYSLIIEGGNANASGGSHMSTNGGAVYAEGSGPYTISECVFRYNSGANNAVVAYFRRTGSNGWIYIDRCEFHDNGVVNSLFGTLATALTHTTTVGLTNNLFHNNHVLGGSSAALIDATSYAYSLSKAQSDKDFYFYQNSFVNNKLPANSTVIRYARGADASWSNYAEVELEVVGNIFWNNQAGPIKFYSTMSKANDVKSLQFYNNLIEGQDTIKTTDLRADFGYSAGSTYNLYPTFTDTAKKDFQITSCGSPTNDRQNYAPQHVLTYLAKDFYGNVRPKGITYDVGHSEIQGELTGLTMTQKGSSLEVSAGYASYLWYDLNSNPPQPIPGATGNTYSPSADGTYAVLIKDNAGCGGLVQGDFCGSVTITITAQGDSLVATGAGAYQWYLDDKIINGASSSSYTPTQNGTYKVASWDPNNPQACTAYKTFDWCGSWPTLAINGNEDSLYAPSGYSGYQWHLNGSAISGATDSLYVATETGNYSVTLSDTLGCSKTTPDYYFKVNGMFSAVESESSLRVYPNPTTGMLRIESNGNDIEQLEVVSITGEQILKVQPQTTLLDLSEFPAGLYFLMISHQNHRTAVRIVKE